MSRLTDNAMHVKMVRMSIPACGVVANDDICRFQFKEANQLGCHLINVRVCESSRAAGNLGISGETRVRVTKGMKSGDAQDPTGLHEFGTPHVSEVVTIGDLLRREPRRAVGCRDKHDAVTVITQSGHRSRRQQCLIVRMCMYEYDCGHALQSDAGSGIYVRSVRR